MSDADEVNIVEMWCLVMVLRRRHLSKRWLRRRPKRMMRRQP